MGESIKGAGDRHPLRAGAAWADITPPAFTFMTGMGRNRPRPAGVHDRLKARALVLQAGAEKLALVAADMNYIDYDSISELRKLVEAYTDIKGPNVHVISSHSHSSPGYFQLGPDPAGWPHWGDILGEEQAHVKAACRLIAGAVYEANLNLADAEIGFGAGTSEYNIVRWHRTPEGRMIYVPSHRELSTNVEPLTDMFVMRVRRRDNGRGLAVFYTNHAHAICVCMQSNLISADYPGVVAREVEARLGGVCMFAPGVIGDQHPREFDTGPEAAERMGRQLAGQILTACERMRYASAVRLAAVETEHHLPDTAQTGQPLFPRTRLSAVAINEIGLSFWPGEPFGMILRRLREVSPFERTVVVSNTDDFKYYFALEEEYGRFAWDADGARPSIYPVSAGDGLFGSAADLLGRVRSARPD